MYPQILKGQVSRHLSARADLNQFISLPHGASRTMYS